MCINKTLVLIFFLHLASLQLLTGKKRQIFFTTKFDYLLVVFFFSFLFWFTVVFIIRSDSIRLLLPRKKQQSEELNCGGDFNLDETLIHKIQSKTDNKQARLRWRGILMRLRLKLRQWAASIKACHTAQQLQIRQLSLGFRALAYRHLHTAVSPRVENTAPQILSDWAPRFVFSLGVQSESGLSRLEVLWLSVVTPIQEPPWNTAAAAAALRWDISFWSRSQDEIIERESRAEHCFRNKIAFIPPNMCSARLRHNLTTFNKSPFVALRLRQEKWNVAALLEILFIELWGTLKDQGRGAHVQIPRVRSYVDALVMPAGVLAHLRSVHLPNVGDAQGRGRASAPPNQIVKCKRHYVNS